MFVERLYESNPEDFKTKIIQIAQMGNYRSLDLKSIDDGILEFDINSPFSPFPNALVVEDFGIWGAYYSEEIDERYTHYMASVFGKEYINAYRKNREEEKLEKIEEFDEETNRFIENMIKPFDRSELPTYYIDQD